jgi:hypothetical protein
MKNSPQSSKFSRLRGIHQPFYIAALAHFIHYGTRSCSVHRDQIFVASERHLPVL